VGSVCGVAVTGYTWGRRFTMIQSLRAQGQYTGNNICYGTNEV